MPFADGANQFYQCAEAYACQDKWQPKKQQLDGRALNQRKVGEEKYPRYAGNDHYT